MKDKGEHYFGFTKYDFYLVYSVLLFQTIFHTLVLSSIVESIFFFYSLLFIAIFN